MHLLLFVNYQSFVCAEVSTVFYACCLLMCVFGHFIKHFFLTVQLILLISHMQSVHVCVCVLFHIQGMSHVSTSSHTAACIIGVLLVWIPPQPLVVL